MISQSQCNHNHRESKGRAQFILSFYIQLRVLAHGLEPLIMSEASASINLIKTIGHSHGKRPYSQNILDLSKLIIEISYHSFYQSVSSI